MKAKGDSTDPKLPQIKEIDNYKARDWDEEKSREMASVRVLAFL